MSGAAAIELVGSDFYRFQPALSITEIEQRLVDLGDVVCRCEDPRHAIKMLEGGEAKSIITRLRLREFIEWLGGLGKANNG
jgi:hypothetical protein